MINTLFGKPTLNVQVDLSGQAYVVKHEVSWFELVYDLAYVAAISSLATTLRDQQNWESFFKFITLFVPLIWAWRSTQKYADRFGGQDLFQILFFLLNMSGIGQVALNIAYCSERKSLTDLSCQGFALPYAFIRFVHIVWFARAAYYLPTARGWCTIQIIGDIISLICWILVGLEHNSTVVSISWVIGILNDFLFTLIWWIPYFHKNYYLPVNREVVIERYGNFFIICLGETILASLVSANAPYRKDMDDYLRNGITILLAFWIQLLYFSTSEDVARHALDGGVYQGSLWTLLHFPMYCAVALIGASIEPYSAHGILSSFHRKVVCVSLATCVACTGLMERLHVTIAQPINFAHRGLQWVSALLDVGFVVALVFTGWTSEEFMAPHMLMAMVDMMLFLLVCWNIYRHFLRGQLYDPVLEVL